MTWWNGRFFIRLDPLVHRCLTGWIFSFFSFLLDTWMNRRFNYRIYFFFFFFVELVNSRNFFFDGKMKEIVLTVFVLFRLSFHTGRRNIMRRGGEKKQVEIQKFFFSECSLIRFGRSRERNQKGNRKQSRDEQLVSF